MWRHLISRKLRSMDRKYSARDRSILFLTSASFRLRMRFAVWGHPGCNAILFGFCGSSVLHGGPVRNRLKGRRQ